MNLPAPPSEQPLAGWKAIADAVGISRATAQRMAARNRDPLPVESYLGGVYAFPSAVAAWRSRQRMPYTTMLALRGRNGLYEAEPEQAPDIVSE